MTNDKMAQNYFGQAEIRLKQIQLAIDEKKWEVVVRQSQEIVELLLKASLRKVGIEPPKWHDVGKIIDENKNRFPDWFQAEIHRLVSISHDLREDREIRFYGDDESDKAANEIFNEEDGLTAFESAKIIFNLTDRLINI